MNCAYCGSKLQAPAPDEPMPKQPCDCGGEDNLLKIGTLVEIDHPHSEYHGCQFAIQEHVGGGEYAVKTSDKGEQHLFSRDQLNEVEHA